MKKNTALASKDICVGVITSVNGVKGYVKIRSFTERPEDLVKFAKVYDESNNNYKLSIISSKKDYIIAGIDGVINRNQAEKLSNTKLFIERAELPKPSNDEYYHADLVGIEAHSEEGIVIGMVKNVLNFGGGDIIEIYDVSTENTVFYPFTKQFIPEVNIEKKYLVLKPLEEIVAAPM